MTLGELLSSVAADLDDVGVAPTPDGGVTWSRGPDVFAAVGADGGSAEFRLDPAIAAAAMRTPDTGSSQRGQGWVQVPTSRARRPRRRPGDGLVHLGLPPNDDARLIARPALKSNTTPVE